LPLGIPRITRAGRSGLNIYRASAARANLANSGTNRLARFAKKTEIQPLSGICQGAAEGRPISPGPRGATRAKTVASAR